MRLGGRRWERLGRGLDTAVVTLIGASIGGQLIRDHGIITQLFFYLPGIPIAATALGWDIFRRGRTLRRPRFGVSILAVSFLAWATTQMFATGADSPAIGDGPGLSLIHWNVRWGGGQRAATRDGWESMVSVLAQRSPDVLVLNETPPKGWLETLPDALGDGFSLAHPAQTVKRDRYAVAVVARGRVALLREISAEGADAYEFEVAVGGSTVRLLAVDSRGTFRFDRGRFIRRVMEASRNANEAGRPYDLIVGDFNAPANSAGFDEFTNAGYRLASSYRRGWRATWHRRLPLYAIDHVFVAPGSRIHRSELFWHPKSDHAGQAIEFRVMDEGMARPSAAGSHSERKGFRR